MRDRIGAYTRSLFPKPIDLVLFDCTTLFFESTCEDTFRTCGYSKVGKHGELQVLLALAVTARVLRTSRYRTVPDSELKVGVFRHGRRRLVVSWSAKRARKDAHDRRRAVAKLIRRLGKSGYHRYVRVVGEVGLEMDEKKIRAAEHWDGLLGVVSNLRGIGVQDLFDRYRQLWQGEEIFRITKHDLRARPVYHWTDRRIRTHLAIAFMAYACVRSLARRVELQKRPMSPRDIREALKKKFVFSPFMPTNVT